MKVDRLVLNALVNGSAALPADNCGPVRVKRVVSLSETAFSDPHSTGYSGP